MNAIELKKRFQAFALRIIKLTERLPDIVTGKTLGNQIIRSGTSSGANYRSVVLVNLIKIF
jgi:four helix bundle protein